MSTQAELDRILKKVASDHVKLTKEQQEFAIKEIGRVRADMADLLAEYANDEGIITRNRIGTLTRDLDQIESNLRKYGTLSMEGIITESSEWTTKKVSDALEKTVGAALTGSQFDYINREVLRYTAIRFGADDLTLSDRVWDLSDNIRSEISLVVRSAIIRGKGISTMIADIRKAYENETWKIKRLAVTESAIAYRAAVDNSAKESKVVEYVKFTAGRRQSNACVRLQETDRYGLGAGIFRPGDPDIYSPHPNCTGYITYVLNPKYL